ncbi:MAG: DNA primase DnaG [Candidatus Bathyarchaeota archaeon]|nr:DNA primase DnaG [Candidatus Bathyarchaeota archaeon]
MQDNEKYAPTTKYVVKAKFEVGGVVEKSDVIGAIFGQTEGLFGPDLDLRELQKSGRIGRIGITLESKNDVTKGEIVIPSSLDKASTALIAAAIESVDRIGPCNAKITLDNVLDEREEKRRVITDKAKEILRRWTTEGMPSTDEILTQVSDSIKAGDVVSYGNEGLPAGSEVDVSSSIILVEGRADVIELLKCGINNVIGIEGTKIPKTIIDLSKEKEITAFLDGDRGGDLILKELMQVAELDYVARAPKGKEVEELTPKEILKCIREKVPLEQIKGKKPTKPPADVPKHIFEAAQELRGTLEAVLFDKKGKMMSKIPVSELAEKLSQTDGVDTVLFDGIVTQRLLDIADEKKVKCLIGDRVSEVVKTPVDIKIMKLSEIIGE